VKNLKNIVIDKFKNENIATHLDELGQYLLIALNKLINNKEIFSKDSILLYSNLWVKFLTAFGTPKSLVVEPIYQSCQP
jgi:hypothetical protein